jgi:hypothetical protein
VSPRQVAAFAKETKWVTDVLHVGAGKSALRYLARYVKRSAFSARNPLGHDRHGNILLRWPHSQTGKVGILTLTPHELIRRWLIHFQPNGFTRVRHYGFLAGAARAARLRVRALLGHIGEPTPKLPEIEPFRCQHCQGELKPAGKLEPVRQRGPPAWKYIPGETEEVTVD